MINSNFFLILLLTIGIVACHKDKPVPIVEAECSDLPFPDDTIALVPRYFEYGDQYKIPCFNPNNRNEFVFNLVNYQTQKYQLIKYNTKSKEKTILLDNILIGYQLKWSTKGWISFDNHITAQVAIIKDNGDSLRVITNMGYNWFPAWSNDGLSLFWNFSFNIGNPRYLLRQGLYESFPDTIYYGVSFYNSISSSDKILSQIYVEGTPYPNIGVAHIASTPLNYESLVIYERAHLEGIEWHTNDRDFFYTEYIDGGLRRYNTNSGSVEMLISHCQTKRYTSISCSPDGSKLLVQRIDTELEFDDNGNYMSRIINQSTISLIEINTLKETRINID